VSSRLRGLDSSSVVVVLACLTITAVELTTQELTLREVSSLLGVIGFIGLVWRGISTLDQMSNLSRALATCLGLLIGVGALAQVLLIRQIGELPEEARAVVPSNTLGVSLVIFARCCVILLVVLWPRLINRWGRNNYPGGHRPV
jgi:ABC-type amino acid transport system permease subunit